MNSRVPLLLFTCFALSVHGQSAAAPSSSASVPTLYQRPNNSDCIASSSSSTNYFPLQFQIAGSSPTEEERVNVRKQTYFALHLPGYIGHAYIALADICSVCPQATVAQDFTVQYMDSYKVLVVQLHHNHLLALCKLAGILDFMLPRCWCR